MNKRKQGKKVDNVIPFPNLERRLMEKGLESLHQNKFHEAISLLEASYCIRAIQQRKSNGSCACIL